MFKTIQLVASVAFIAATLFTLWTPTNLFSGDIINSLASVSTQEPVNESEAPESSTANNTQRVGIVAGHWNDDSGYICADGRSEESINLRIATLVTQNLRQQGYTVDLLEEFDNRLYQYKGIALISIHTGSCEFEENGSGFKISPGLNNVYIEKADQLTNSIIQSYQQTTGLKYLMNEITDDMSTYHTFNEVHTTTPVVIMEAAHLNLDKETLSENTELIAEGISTGIANYIEQILNGSVPESEDE